MAFLTAEQIERLLKKGRGISAKDLEMIVKICLTADAQWSEAEN